MVQGHVMIRNLFSLAAKLPIGLHSLNTGQKSNASSETQGNALAVTLQFKDVYVYYNHPHSKIEQ